MRAVINPYVLDQQRTNQQRATGTWLSARLTQRVGGLVCAATIFGT